MEEIYINQALLNEAACKITAWYEENAQPLPWRENRDAYRVWLSEIMLQQTRIEAAIPYYQRFLQRFSTVQALAAASEEEVLKAWEGLGYYSRARNLHRAAKLVAGEYGGRFPQSSGELRRLPGIGEYTAGAIASICFNQPSPAVDGNVLRVLARLLCLEGNVYAPPIHKALSQALEKAYPKENRGGFTQGLMELGQRLCLPKGRPLCQSCPLQGLCLARRGGKQQALPKPREKAARKSQKWTVFVIRRSGTMALLKRGKGLLGGLWELPNLPGHLEARAVGEACAAWGLAGATIEQKGRAKHVFTHVEWDMLVYTLAWEGPAQCFVWAGEEDLRQRYTLPVAFRRCL